MTTKAELSIWFDRGVESGAKYMIVAVDTYDWENYPVYVMPGDSLEKEKAKRDNVNMQRIMEVYDLSIPFSVGSNTRRFDA